MNVPRNGVKDPEFNTIYSMLDHHLNPDRDPISLQSFEKEFMPILYRWSTHGLGVVIVVDGYSITPKNLSTTFTIFRFERSVTDTSQFI
jgi:hypothetical protein